MTRRPTARVVMVAPVLVALCVVVARPPPGRRRPALLVAPGKLARAHAHLEGKCDSCHVPFKGIPDSACLACHEKTASRIQEGRGPHAVFARQGPQGKRCVSCHSDHKGPGHNMTPPVGEPFDHQVTGFTLAGAHVRAACAKCHPTANGSTRWTELARDCVGCHQRNDVHSGTLGKRCDACHSEESFKAVRHGRAEHKVPLSGAHAALDCTRCHGNGAHLSPRWSCGDCHNQSHGGTRAPCATCHVPETWKKATFTHDFCTCILPGKHQTADCLGCHPAFKFNPTPMECAGCHKKDLKHEPLGPCSRCHSALSFKARVFDHDKPSVGFQLKDRHFEVGCENCHTRKAYSAARPSSARAATRPRRTVTSGPAGSATARRGSCRPRSRTPGRASRSTACTPRWPARTVTGR